MPQDRFVLLVPSPDGESVLVRRGGGADALPVVSGDRARDLPVVLADARAELASLGVVGARFLRTAGRVEVGEDRWSLLVHDAAEDATVEDDAAAGGAPGAAWARLDAADLGALGVPPGLHEVARRWTAELAGAPAPPARAAWARPGGIGPFLAWVGAAVRATGAVPVGEPEVVRQWAISCVLRVATDRGALYAKAVGPYFASEPALTRTLARRTPGLLPGVVAADAARGRLLLADAGLRAVDPHDPAASATALRALAAAQRAWAPEVPELVAAGAAERGLATLGPDLVAVLGLVADARRLVPSIALGPDVAARLADAARVVGRAAERAAGDGVPTTLLHGDFHPGNAGLRADGSACVLDWSDAAVGHPFLDADLWLSHLPDEQVPAARRAYADAWPEVPGGEEAVARAAVLGAAYQLVTSARLLEAVEEDERVPFARGTLFWARRLLEVAAPTPGDAAAAVASTAGV